MSSICLRRTQVQLIRFLLVGAANTIVTGAIFLALSTVLASPVAYTIAFAVGLVFVVLATPRLVFRTSAGPSRRVVFGLLYLCVYLVGLAVVFVLNDWVRLDRPVVVVLTLVVTASISFLGGRYLFGARSSGATPK